MAARKGYYSDFDHVAEHIEQMWDHLTTGSSRGPRLAPTVIEPPVDVYQTDTEVVVLMEVAGMRDQDVEIQIEGRRLTVRGEKRDRRSHSADRVYSTIEIQHGPFERVIALPVDVDYERVNVQYDDGMLQITLQRRARELERRVRVTVR